MKISQNFHNTFIIMLQNNRKIIIQVIYYLIIRFYFLKVCEIIVKVCKYFISYSVTIQINIFLSWFYQILAIFVSRIIALIQFKRQFDFIIKFTENSI